MYSVIFATIIAAYGAEQAPRYALKLCWANASVTSKDTGLSYRHEVVGRGGERPCRGPFDEPLTWAQFFRIVDRPELAPSPEPPVRRALRMNLVGGMWWTASSLGHLLLLNRAGRPGDPKTPYSVTLGAVAVAGLGMLVTSFLLAPDPPPSYEPDLPGQLAGAYNARHGLTPTATSSTGPPYLRSLRFRYYIPGATRSGYGRDPGRHVTEVRVQRGDDPRLLGYDELGDLVGSAEGLNDPETRYGAAIGLGTGGVLAIASGVALTAAGYIPDDRNPVYFGVGHALTLLGLALVTVSYEALAPPDVMRDLIDAQIAPYNRGIYEALPPSDR